uniref:Vesicle transport protein n=1 Tax=Araucaria cunninghamii TaxID=56994 RepID=A0A0D6R8J0_ARACU
MNRAMGRFRSLVGGEDNNEEEEDMSLMDDFSGHCNLSTEQRLYGFAACLAGGLLLTLLSLLLFLHPIKFAVAFTFGNLLSLASTTFLVGPVRQMKMMFDPVRVVASAIFIGSIVIALFCALYIHNKLLTLLAIIVEFCALLWYSLSYIPFARSAARKFMGSCFDTEF